MDENSQKIIKFPEQKANCVSIPPSKNDKVGRLPDRFLRQLRNRVPIQSLIRSSLGLANHVTDGIFRFECPVCKAFHTSVKKETNLARCFDCQTNFNPIDMVMVVKKISFRESTTFLSGLLGTELQKEPEKRGKKGPEEIKEVLYGSRVGRALPPSPQTDTGYSKLEEEVQLLKRRMDELQKFVIKEISRRNSRLP